MPNQTTPSTSGLGMESYLGHPLLCLFIALNRVNQTQHRKHRARKTGMRGLSGRRGRQGRPGLKIAFLKFLKGRNLLNQKQRISSWRKKKQKTKTMAEYRDCMKRAGNTLVFFTVWSFLYEG